MEKKKLPKAAIADTSVCDIADDYIPFYMDVSADEGSKFIIGFQDFKNIYFLSQFWVQHEKEFY